MFFGRIIAYHNLKVRSVISPNSAIAVRETLAPLFYRLLYSPRPESNSLTAVFMKRRVWDAFTAAVKSVHQRCLSLLMKVPSKILAREFEMFSNSARRLPPPLERRWRKGRGGRKVVLLRTSTHLQRSSRYCPIFLVRRIFSCTEFARRLACGYSDENQLLQRRKPTYARSQMCSSASSLRFSYHCLSVFNIVRLNIVRFEHRRIVVA